MAYTKKLWVVATILLVSLSLFISTSQDVAGERSNPPSNIHLNILGDDQTLSHETETDPAKDPATRVVNSDVGGESDCTKWNGKSEVAVGEWKMSIPNAMKSSGAISFNLFADMEEQCTEDDVVFRFRILLDSEEVTNQNAPATIYDDRIVEVTGNANNIAMDLRGGQELTLEIYYDGWYDARIYYDNQSFDSGMATKFDSLYTFDAKNDGKTISLEVFDGFDGNWDKMINADFVKLQVDGTVIPNNEAQVKGGKSRDLGNGTMATTSVLEWKTTTSGNSSIQLDLGFAPNSPSLTVTSFKAGGGGGDDDSPSLGVIGSMAAVMTALMVATLRRRN